MSTSLIGDSILEFMDQTDRIQNAPRSIIHSLIVNEGNVLVQGPYATSLAMNAACAIATGCQCRLVSCHCVAVTFLTLRKKPFPLFCQEAPQSSDDLEEKLRKLDNATATWNWQALKRIQVVRFQSARNLISYLLNLHAQQPRQRPWGALIVDGVDHFITNGDQKATAIGPDGIIRMTQILALLAETGKTLERMGTDPLLIMATTRLTIPLNAERIVRNWYPRIVTVEQRCGKPHWCPPNGDVIQSSWLAKLNDSDRGAAISFCVMRKKTKAENVIVWCQQT
ncbi:hypothetical protein MHU86_23953 [Fragilaria crotonensis]|nr:hypothetical protein MHU86_23953 [Fragilaria crotonensis]